MPLSSAGSLAGEVSSSVSLICRVGLVGLGHLTLTQEATGSNPVRDTSDTRNGTFRLALVREDIAYLVPSYIG